MADSTQDDSFNRIVTGTGFIVIGTTVGMGSTFLSRVLVANAYGPDRYGVLVLALTALNFLTIISSLGLEEGLGRELPRADQPAAFLNAAISLALPISILVSVVLLISARPIEASLAIPSLGLFLIVFGVSLPFNVIRQVVGGGFRGSEDPLGRVLTENVFYQFLVLLLVILAVVWGLELRLLAWLWTLAIIVSGIAGLWLVRSRLAFEDAVGVLARPDSSRAKSLLVFSVPLMFSDTVWELLKQADTFLLGYFATSTAVGVYDAAFTLGHLILIAGGFFGFISLPVFSDLHSAGRMAEFRETYKQVTKWMVFLTLPLYLFLTIIPGPFLAFGFGPEYVGGSAALQIVATGFFLHMLAGQNSLCLLAVGKNQAVLAGSVLAVVLNVLLNVVLIPRYGIAGAAVASAGAYLVTNGYFTLSLWSSHSVVPFGRSVPGSVAITIGGSLASTYLLDATLGHGNGATTLLAVMAIPLFLVVGIHVGGGIDQNDWELFYDLLRRIPRGPSIIQWISR